MYLNQIVRSLAGLPYYRICTYILDTRRQHCSNPELVSLPRYFSHSLIWFIHEPSVPRHTGAPNTHLLHFEVYTNIRATHQFLLRIISCSLCIILYFIINIYYICFTINTFTCLGHIYRIRRSNPRSISKDRSFYIIYITCIIH